MGRDYRLSPEDLKAQVNVLFVQYVVIRYKIDEDIQCCISTTTGYVTEGLNRQKPLKRRIKEINRPTNALTQPC